MLRRDRQIRMQIQQLVDACLFALSFWLALALRANPAIVDLFDLTEWSVPLETYLPLWLVLVPRGAADFGRTGFLRAAGVVFSGFDRLDAFQRLLLQQSGARFDDVLVQDSALCTLGGHLVRSD